jgi:hypothetical protein
MTRFFMLFMLACGMTALAQEPVTVSIEIPADVAAHLEALRTSGQYVKSGDLIDGLPSTEPMYATLAEFVIGELNRVWLGPLLDRFPTAAIEQRLAVIKTERDAIEALKQESVREPDKGDVRGGRYCWWF